MKNENSENKRLVTQLDKPFIKNLDFDQDRIDFMDAQERKELIFTLFKNQFIFNKKSIPFYNNLYKDISEDSLSTLNDCIELVPAINKDMIRNLESPYDLLDDNIKNNLHKIYLHRGTGGTTGEPTNMFFSYNDWRAILGAMTRPVKELRALNKQIIAFNGYNQGHISGPIFDDTIRKIGGTSISRNFGSTDEQAVKQMKKHMCNLIIAPPTSTHKGGSVEALLDVDAKLGLNYINGENIDVIFCSSTNLTKELYKELKNLGIKYIYNYYGSTDVLPTAISCQVNPFDLHILSGHIALFVVDNNQKHVSSNQRGLVISSKIASYDDSGNASTNEGTQLLNFHVGDEVTFVDEPCTCGRTTPRIRDIKRVSFLQDKLESGCEQW